MTFPDTTFVQGTTITSNWLNAVNDAIVDGSANISYTPPFTGGVTESVGNKLAQTISVKDFGAVGDGVTNDAPAIAATITAVIAAGGGTVYFPAGKYKCTTRIGTFVNASNLTLFGYGAEIQNYAGISVFGLIEFGDSSRDVNGLYEVYATTVNQLKILGLKFTSSNIFNVTIPGRWSDQMPLSINTAKDVIIKDCYFENWDFAAINFGAMCLDALVDGCTFYSSEVDAGHANYGVRIFCYANYNDYQNGNGAEPTDFTTGVLKSGYAFVSDNSTTWGHDGINVTNCYFENVSHGVMVSASRRGIISNNRFKNMSTRSVSLTTYSTDYLCCDNTHVLDTTQQTSTGVSVFYGLGQATYRHQIQGDKFIIMGGTNNATGFSPIKCYINSHDWIISDCVFDIPSWAAPGGPCISVQDNSDGVIRDNHFACPNVTQPISIGPAYSVSSPAYQQANIWIIGNVFESCLNGSIAVLDTTSSPSPIIIKDNIVNGGDTRFIATIFSAPTKVAKLFMQGNQIFSNIPRYVDNTTSNKAIILETDLVEFYKRLSTGGGVANPSTTAVSFDFSNYNLPACFSNGTKSYQFTTYGSRSNGQASTDFYFAITGETATSISGNIIRNAGSSFQIGYTSMRVVFEPYNT